MTEPPQPYLRTEEPDDLPSILEEAFGFKPCLSYQSPDADQHPYQGTLPFDFYDRHIDANLALKRVVVLSSIPTSLANKVDATLGELRRHKIGPLPLGHSTIGQFSGPLYREELEGLITPGSMAIRYLHSYGNLIPALASSWIVHPLAPKYFSTIEFRSKELPNAPFYLESTYTLRFKAFEDQREEVMSSIDAQTTSALKELAGKELITCMFLPMCEETEDLFRRMDELQVVFPSPAYTTSGSKGAIPSSNRPCDARETPWTITPLEDEPEPPEKSTRKRSKDIRPTLRKEASSEFELMKTTTPAGLLHHVWHRSVAENTTLILIHCGNYERIGIRHRASQTLFLSELLDISCFDQPSYGQVHFGLFLSAVSDALDRYGQVYTPSSSVKRPNPNAEPELRRRSKRQKVKGTMNIFKSTIKRKTDSQSVVKGLHSRTLGLVSVNFGPLNSPVPAACLRTGGVLSSRHVGPNVKTWKKVYKFHKCFKLILESDMAFGGTGRLHSGRLEVETPTHISCTEVAVKAAVEPKLRKRLRQEYSVYRHLWKHEVSRIPLVYGLLEDSDDMVTFLVLEKLGMSFRDREPIDAEGGGLLVCVTAKERSLCLATLREIHQAGVLHRDLRAENILLGHDGTPMIIDFDHAQLNPESGQTVHEMNRFRELLDGEIVGKVIFFSSSTDG